MTSAALDQDQPLVDPARRWMRIALVGMVLAFLAIGLVQADQDSPSVDEGVDLASGLTYWVHHDLRMNPEHPPLPKLLATLPALVAHPIVPKGAAWYKGDWFEHADLVLRSNDEAGRLDEVLFLSRLVPLLEAVGCGLLIYALGRRLTDEAGGLLAAGIWFSTPFFLGLGHMGSIDISFTLATLAVAMALLRYRESPTLGRAVTVGLLLGATLLVRHTGLALVPVVLAVVAVPTWRDREATIRTVGATLLVAYGVLWLGYRGFDLTAPGGVAGANLHGAVDQASADSLLARLVLLVPAPLEWKAGFGVLILTSDPRPAWLFGQAWVGSKPWFFPGSLLAKMPLPALLALIGGAVAWRGRPGPARRNALVSVGVPAIVLLLFVMAQPLNLGLRLALPSVALLCVLGAPAADVLRSRAGQAAVALLALTQIAAMAFAGTHSLAWSPPPFSPAYRYVSDSNVDFGQSLWELRDWSEGRRPWVAIITPRGLERPAGSRDLVKADPTEVRGWVAVGVTSLTVLRRDELAWLRAYCPVGELGGGSILLYRFDEPPSGVAGPTRPESPCAGAEFSRRTA